MSDAGTRSERIEGAPVLSWVADLLWPERSGVDVSLAPGHPRPPAGTRAWAAIPTAAEPTILVPLLPRAGAAALHQFNQSMSQAARVRKAIGGLVFRVGAGRLVGHGQLRVAATDSSASRDDLIETLLTSVTGATHVDLAISVGRALRPNLKPVLQVLDRSGDPIAYVKVGWNPLTTALVRNEARTLEAWAAAPPRTFGVPRLLGERTWNELSLTILSPVPHRLWRRGPRNQPPPAPMLAEVAELGGIEGATLGDSAFGSEVRSRIEVLGDTRAAGVLAGASRELIDGAGHLELRFGRAHGDWSPWNMGRVGDRWFVWDWERSSRPVPVGLDALHFGFEVSFHKEGSRVEEAATTALHRTTPFLHAVGVDASARPVLLRLFLIERLLRLEEGRTLGVAVDERLADGLRRTLAGGSR